MVSHSVLLVDDDPKNLNLLRDLLEKDNFQVFTACDGTSGLEFLKKRQVEMVITDLHMPRMNGLEFTVALRDVPGSENVPVLLMTSGTQPMDFSSVPFKAQGICLKSHLPANLKHHISMVLPNGSSPLRHK